MQTIIPDPNFRSCSCGRGHVHSTGGLLPLDTIKYVSLRRSTESDPVFQCGICKELNCFICAQSEIPSGKCEHVQKKKAIQQKIADQQVDRRAAESGSEAVHISSAGYRGFLLVLQVHLAEWTAVAPCSLEWMRNSGHTKDDAQYTREKGAGAKRRERE